MPIDGQLSLNGFSEVMLCDFTSGVSVVSFANLVSRGDILLGMNMGSSTGFHAREVLSWLFTADAVSFEVMNSGSWHNQFPGETRIRLDLAGLISFYDTQLVPSLVDIRAGQERWDHRVQNISSEDLSTLKSRLEEILVRPEGMSSGIDWETLVRVIVDRYAGRLELIHYFLNSSATDRDDMLHFASKAQTQLRIMLTPYILFSATPTEASDKSNLNWTVPVYKMCATTHTSSMESEVDSMTDSEKLLLSAVRATTREICRVVTKMWAVGVYAGIDPLLNPKESPDVVEITRLWDAWVTDLGHLTAWLDWNVWIKCNPGCGPEVRPTACLCTVANKGSTGDVLLAHMACRFPLVEAGPGWTSSPAIF